MKRNEDSLRGPWYNIKCTSICIIGVPEGEETEKGPENTFEVIIDENFPNMGKEIVNQVQEVQRVPGRINLSRWNRVIWYTWYVFGDIKFYYFSVDQSWHNDIKWVIVA